MSGLIRIVVSGFLVLLFCSTAGAWDKEAYNREHSECFKAGSIRSILRLPDEKIDLAAAIIELASSVQPLLRKDFPEVDVDKLRSSIDEFADAVELRIGDEKNPFRIMEIMSEYFYSEQRFHYYGGGVYYSSIFIGRAIEHRRVSMLTNMLLYLCVAERLDIPLFGVISPDKRFVRFDDGKTRFNIGDYGRIETDAYYRERACMADDYNGFYMRSLSKREVIGYYISVLGVYLGYSGFVGKSLELCNLGCDINPGFEESYRLLGVAYRNSRSYQNAVSACMKAVEISPKDYRACLDLAISYYRHRSFDLAIKTLKSLIEDYPQVGDAYYWMGVVFDDRKWKGKAINILKKGLQADPLNARVVERIAKLLDELGRDVDDILSKSTKKKTEFEPYTLIGTREVSSVKLTGTRVLCGPGGPVQPPPRLERETYHIETENKHKRYRDIFSGTKEKFIPYVFIRNGISRDIDTRRKHKLLQVELGDESVDVLCTNP